MCCAATRVGALSAVFRARHTILASRTVIVAALLFACPTVLRVNFSHANIIPVCLATERVLLAHTFPDRFVVTPWTILLWFAAIARARAAIIRASVACFVCTHAIPARRRLNTISPIARFVACLGAVDSARFYRLRGATLILACPPGTLCGA